MHDATSELLDILGLSNSLPPALDELNISVYFSFRRSGHASPPFFRRREVAQAAGREI